MARGGGLWASSRNSTQDLRARHLQRPGKVPGMWPFRGANQGNGPRSIFVSCSAANNLVPVDVCQAVRTQPIATSMGLTSALPQNKKHAVLPLACRSVTWLPQVTSNNLGAGRPSPAVACERGPASSKLRVGQAPPLKPPSASAAGGMPSLLAQPTRTSSRNQGQ